jgi:hypothetical protein
VDIVIIAGRMVLGHGRFSLVDERVIFTAVQASVDRMLRRLGFRGGGSPASEGRRDAW